MSYSTLSPERARMLGRLGGLSKSSRHDPHEGTKAARDGFAQKFLNEVDPDRILPGSRAQPESGSCQETALSTVGYEVGRGPPIPEGSGALRWLGLNS